jgi:hypothetical protein
VTFPINSTSVMTPACGRVGRVMQRVAREGLISYGGVFSCRKIAGTNYWSQHAWGNALDLFPRTARTTTRSRGPRSPRLRSAPSPTGGASSISPTSSTT